MKLKPIVKNTSIQLVGRIAGAAVSFCATFLLARSLGPAYFGDYTKITTLIVLFYFLVDLGLNAIFLKDLEKNPTQKSLFVRKLIGLRLLLAVMACIGVSLLAGLVWYISGTFTPLVVVGVCIGSLSIFAYGTFLTISGFFQHVLDFKTNVIATLSGSLLWLVVIYVATQLFVNQPESQLLLVIVGFVLGGLLTMLYALLRLMAFAHIALPIISLPFAKRIIKESFPLITVLLVNLIYFRIDIWVLSYYRTSAEIGAYALAYRFFDFAIALPILIINSLYPILLKKNEVLNKTTIWFVGLGFTFVAVVIVLIFWIMAPFLTIIRSDYVEAISFLRILSLSIPVFYLTAPIMWFFILKQKQKQLILIYVPALIVNVVANLILVPYYGAYASAAITGGGELVILLLGICLLIKNRNYE